jgi:tetratricopeptide (TPR) repeat protein
MKKIIISLFILSLNLSFAFSQQADSVLNKAVMLIDKGELVEAEKEIKKSIAEGIDTLPLHYELAWIYYITKDYDNAIKTLEPLCQRSDVTPDVYQLIGNAYDEKGQFNSAVTQYNKGLEKFPNAGCLYLEKGNIAYKSNRYEDAFFYYEKGIELDPEYPSNYYRASLLFFASTEMVWGAMYGEIFMNLEQHSEARCKEMSQTLYNCYFDQIKFNSRTPEVDFNNPVIVYSNSEERPNLFPESFRSAMTKACKGYRFLDLNTLVQIRRKFITEFYATHSDFANVLFDYHKKLISEGHFEAYNYWLFAYGNNEQANRWVKQNQTKWNAFLQWKKENPLTITQDNVFSRYTME